MVPTRQGLPATGQLVPAAHPVQTPSWQTEFSSQVVPLSCSLSVS